MWEPSIDPAREYDNYCAKQEEAYRARIAGMTCGDCGNCVAPDEKRWKNAERMGYCMACGDFVGLDDSVEEEDCGDFE